jgi:sortase A
MTATVSDETLRVVVDADPPRPPLTPERSRRALTGLALVLAGVAIASVVLVEFVVGSVLQQRDQRVAAEQLDAKLATAATSIGLPDVSPLPVVAPRVGEPVAVLEIPSLGLTQVVLEGEGNGVTQAGPGHVSGTPLPGQPGNAGVAGRRTSYGAPFFELDALTAGDVIRTTTVQGQAEYTVTDVSVFTGEDPFERSDANQLTLVTGNPPGLALNPLVVRAELEGDPYVPTPQAARSFRSPTGADFSQWAEIVVWGLVLAAVVAATVTALRSGVRRPVVWVLATPTVTAGVVQFARSIDHVLPTVL